MESPMSDDLLDDDYTEASEPDSPPENRLTPAPRELPEDLSGRVVKWFVGWTVVGLVAAGIFLGVGLSERSDYRSLQEAKYFGEYVVADVERALSEEGEYWLFVTFPYGGQQHRAEVDTTSAEFSMVRKTGRVEVVFWPEAPTDAATLGWINQQSAMSEYGIWMIIGMILMLISLLVGTLGMLKRKKRYEKGVEAWGEQVGPILYDNDSSRYSTTLSFTHNGTEYTDSVSWTNGKNPFTDEMDRFLGLVLPGKPDKFYLLDMDEVDALEA